MSTTGTIPLLHEDGPRVGARGWAALIVLMLPVLLVSVDNTVLAFAIPEISLALAPSGTEQLWIIDVYSLVLAGLLVTMGVLGDRFGRRRMLLIGATGFAVTSAIAAFAPTAGLLIAARAVLGVFGAMLMPSTLSLLRSVFRNRDQRRLAIAVWAAAFSAGSALGPVVGGILLEHFWWGAVFLIAVPVLVPLLIGGLRLLSESSDPDPGRIDPLGILLSMAAMTPVVFAIKSLAVDGVNALAAVLLLAGAAAAALFVRRMRRAAHPMLDMTLFRRGGFSGAILVNLLSIIALVGFLYFVSQQLQLVIGLSPLVAGLALVPGMAAMIVAGLCVVPISRRVAPHIVVPTALSLSALGYAMVAATASLNSAGWLMGAFVVLGLGIGAAETISNELILANAPAAKAGAASAVSETAYELGAVLGTAVLGGIITAFYRGALRIPEGVPTAAAAEARETLAGAYTAVGRLPERLGGALWEAASSAFGSGVVTTSIIGALLVCGALIVALVTLRPERRRTPR
ncbi:MFS transporter [Microbacterium soli]|uniref:MFS transporter n=1 Tax=Microbacterium soli TaxID=446075 RepID=A0ABP7MLW5_9MICO